MKQSEAARGRTVGQGCGIALRVCAGLIARMSSMSATGWGVVCAGESGSSSGVQVGAVPSRRRKRAYSQIAATRSAMGRASPHLYFLALSGEISCSSRARSIAANP